MEDEREVEAQAIYGAIASGLEPNEDPDPRQTVRLVRDIADVRVRARVMELLQQRSVAIRNRPSEDEEIS